MVNCLLTMLIKVNVALICRIAGNDRGRPMKKTQTRVGFWSWLAGYGWASAGGNG